jgi:O-antigen/teichoic acid export membrane protein
VIIVFLGNTAVFILLLLGMRLATSYLPPEEMGRLSLILAVTAFFALFLVHPVGMFINRRLHAWDALGRAKYYLKLHALYLLMVSMITAGSLVVLNALGAFDFQFNMAWLLVLVCGSLFFNTINQTAIPSLNLLEFRGRFFILTLATIGMGLVSAYLLIRVFSTTAEYWLMGLLIGQAVLAVVGVAVLFLKLQTSVVAQRPTKSHLRILFSFAWPVAVSVGFNWLQMQGYRFLALNSLGLAELGLFIAGYGICAALMGGFEIVMTTYLQPRFYKHASNSNVTTQSLAWNKYGSAILPSLVLVAFMLIAMAPEITRFMVGPAYQSSSQFVVWGVLAEGLRVVAGVYGMAAHAKMQTRLLILPNFMGAIICTVLILTLAPKLGAHGVGLARTIAGIGLVLAMHYLMTTALEMKLPYRLLLKAAVMGVLLWLMASAGRLAMDGTASLTSAGLLIVVVGLVFVPMFYWLMFPFLSINDNPRYSIRPDEVDKTI